MPFPAAPLLFLLATAFGQAFQNVRAQPDDLVLLLKREYVAIHSAPGSHAKALHSYLLNDAADRFAQSMNEKYPDQDKSGSTLLKIREANRYGASIHRCAYSGDWTAGSEAYLRSLALWPSSPQSEEAWWRGKLLHKLNACYDAAGTKEEVAGFVRQYRQFLNFFPHGRHAAEAREALNQFQADLAGYNH